MSLASYAKQQALDITIKDRGCVPRRLSKTYTAGSKKAWFETIKAFHQHLRDARFTEEHARVARYAKRTKAYLKEKQQKFGHQRPLEYSGETRRAVRSVKITGKTSYGTAAYAGARKLNFRRGPNAPNMAKEFRHITADEKKKLAAAYDVSLNRELNADQTTSTRTL